jgi:hypothetical protein|tara:strand:+ start:4428 stop:4610 length:183 start_codon:yes stop_codon:yes gene_type:complete
MRNLDNHRYIGEAIQLLQAKGEKAPLPWWVKPLDYVVTALFLSAYLFAAFKLIQWLLNKI